MDKLGKFGRILQVVGFYLMSVAWAFVSILRFRWRWIAFMLLVPSLNSIASATILAFVSLSILNLGCLAVLSYWFGESFIMVPRRMFKNFNMYHLGQINETDLEDSLIDSVSGLTGIKSEK